MRFKAGSTSSRVQEQIRNQPLASFEAFDLYRTIVKPDFKQLNQKNKWLDKAGFSISKVSRNGSPAVASAWTQQTNHAAQAGRVPFIAGLSKLGVDESDRPRLKHKEVSPKPFDGTIRADNHRNTKYVINNMYSSLSLKNQLKQVDVLSGGDGGGLMQALLAQKGKAEVCSDQTGPPGSKSRNINISALELMGL